MAKLEFHFYYRGGGDTSLLKIFILKCLSVMAVNGRTLVNREAYYYYRKKSYPLPTPRTLPLSSQVSGLSDFRGVTKPRTTKQRILGGGSDDTEQSTLGSAGSAPGIPSSQRGCGGSSAARSFNWCFSHLLGLHVKYYVV